MGLLGSLLGTDQQKALKRGKKASDAAMQAGYDEGNAYYDQAFDILDPFVSGGVKGNAMYDQAIGLGTPEERSAAQGTYFSDPVFQQITDQNNNAMLRYLNARGEAGGGKAALAGTRIAYDGYNSWLDRLRDRGTQGGQFATQQSAIRTGQGDMRYGYGLTKAGQETNFANAMAQAKGIGINNLLKVGEVAAKAIAASDVRLKRDIRRVDALPSGLPVYRFRYLDDDAEHIGVMAQEAREIFPDAVVERPDGYLMVDYSRIS